MGDVMATGEIVENPEGVDTSGFYYRVKSREETSEWIGPYETERMAEEDFMWAMREATHQMVVETLGLE